jgi:hypothetical protein
MDATIEIDGKVLKAKVYGVSMMNDFLAGLEEAALEEIWRRRPVGVWHELIGKGFECDVGIFVCRRCGLEVKMRLVKGCLETATGFVVATECAEFRAEGFAAGPPVRSLRWGCKGSRFVAPCLSSKEVV